MTNIITQLNIIKYSKEDFLIEKSKLELTCSESLTNLLKIIETNIKMSGGNNSPFTNTHNKTSYGGKKHTNSKHNIKHINLNIKPSDSWRITKTKIIPTNISEIDKKQNEINSLLNKLSPKNYEKIVGKILDYYKDSETDNIDNTSKSVKDTDNKSQIPSPSLIDLTINTIFLKAVLQPVYCPYYVKFLKTIDEKYNKFHIINQKCIEFKNIVKPPKLLDESKSISLSEKEQYDLFCKANKEKKYKEGYSQFIGELFNKVMIKMSTLEENLYNFVEALESSSKEDAKSANVEDLLICICKIIYTVYNKKCKDNKDMIHKYIKRINVIKTNPDLPKRLQFKIMDLVDAC
tara:strand:+ start:3025 stop:4068 length:1044 start_codon:yes stop_codon:yes gene_type:complete